MSVRINSYLRFGEGQRLSPLFTTWDATPHARTTPRSLRPTTPAVVCGAAV